MFFFRKVKPPALQIKIKLSTSSIDSISRVSSWSLAPASYSTRYAGQDAMMFNEKMMRLARCWGCSSPAGVSTQ